MELKSWAFEYYRTHSTKEFESFNNETSPLGFVLKSGDEFEWNIQQYYDRFDEPFDITDSVIIPKGKYWAYRNELQIETYTARPVWGGIAYSWGDFYSGRLNILEAEIGINVNSHLNFETGYTYNKAKLPQGNVITHELEQYINYAFTTKLDLSLFIQWNSLDDILFGNFRLHCIPKIGTDLYFVYNSGYEEASELDFLKPNTSSAIGKLVWRFTF